MYCGDGETYVLGCLCTSVVINREALINLLICYTINDSILHGERLSSGGYQHSSFCCVLVFDVQ